MNSTLIQRLTRCIICNDPLPNSKITCLKCGKECSIGNLPSTVGEVFDAKSSCCASDIDVSSYPATCSHTCHEKFVECLEKQYGKHKKVISMETNNAHRVPTRDIIEKGLKAEDLKNYPLWKDTNE